ncbi:CPBP family intramembrane metalloprotease [Candidatus Saccharibacteria bacterium]|nr:CPBP family intramembrane metalloprotease [Candidatus Saccharibacteria bacterium]
MENQSHSNQIDEQVAGGVNAQGYPMHGVPMAPPMTQKPKMSDRTKGVVALVTALGVYFGVGVVAMVVWLVASGTDIMGMDEAALMEAVPGWVLFLPHVVLLVVFGLMYWSVIKGDAKKMTKKTWVVVALGSVGILAVNFALSALFYALDVDVANQEVAGAALESAMVIGMFSIVVAAPVWEEVVFRRALHDVVKNPVVFVILSGLVFGLLHWSGVATLSYILIGAMFAGVYLASGKNLMAAILVHFVNNLVAVVLMLAL